MDGVGSSETHNVWVLAGISAKIIDDGLSVSVGVPRLNVQKLPPKLE